MVVEALSVDVECSIRQQPQHLLAFPIVTAGFLIVLVNCCRSDPARAGAKEDARLNP